MLFLILLIVLLLAALMVAISLGLAKAYQSAPPSIIATFDYSYLLFAAFWSFVIFSQPPDAPTVLGMAMIAGAGLLVVRGAGSVRARAPQPTARNDSPMAARRRRPSPPTASRRGFAHQPLTVIITNLEEACRSLAGWFCRPGRSNLHEFSDHMLKDMGIDPVEARRESGSGFWRVR